MKKKLLFIFALFLIFPAAVALADATICFDGNGGSGVPGSIFVSPDASGVVRFSLPTEVPSRSGYNFIGWNCKGLEYEYPLDPPGKSIAFSQKSGTITYVAQWKPINGSESCPYLIAQMQDLRGDYDALQIDFKCVQDANYTYWAVHCWDDDNFGMGYAGFQHTEDGYVLILSVWDVDDIRPSIEYSPYAIGGEDFDGEGTGKHIISQYAWEPMRWYTMRIQAVTDGNKTIYEQWLCPEGGTWQKIAAISIPKPNCGFIYNMAFLEDFWPYSNDRRSCQLKNACARERNTQKWKMNYSYDIYNYDDQRFRELNVQYNCVAEQCSDAAIFLQTGGSDATRSITLPKTIKVSRCENDTK